MSVYLIGGIRTPIGKTNGILKNFLPEQLAAYTLNAILTRYHLGPENIDMVLLGNATGPGGNIARVAVLTAGWPYSNPAISIDGQCGSGLNTLQFASALIESGQADLVLAGGCESTTMAPQRQFNVSDPRYDAENPYFSEAPFSPPTIGNPGIGEAAEKLADTYKITREAMDLWAFQSHQKALKAKNKNLLKNIILPLNDNNTAIINDECLRPSLTPRLLSRLPGAFMRKSKITAGNSCLKHDGAAVILLASEHALQKYSLEPQAVILQNTILGCDPNFFPLSPVSAVQKLLALAEIELHQIACMEINEAFSVKILTCCHQLNFPLEKVNILGGALAYGHPYGASGAIITLHLLEALKSINGKYGIATIGAVGGLGTAQLIERIN